MVNPKSICTKYQGNLVHYEKNKPRNTGIEEGEYYQIKWTENIFNKIINENFSNQKTKLTIKVQEAYRSI